MIVLIPLAVLVHDIRLRRAIRKELALPPPSAGVAHRGSVASPAPHMTGLEEG